MLTEIAALIDLGIGCIWFVGQAWFWVLLGGIGEILYSVRGFAGYSVVLLLLLADPVCLILGGCKTHRGRPTAVSTTLNLIAFFEMAYFLVPVAYDALRPAPLVYVDMRFTVVVAAMLLLTFWSSGYLALLYFRGRKQMKRVKLDAA